MRRHLLALLLFILSSAAVAAPSILAAAEDEGELLIIGRDFGASPSVRLGELPLVVRGSSDVVIRAVLPAIGVEPGSYALTVYRNALPRMPSEPFHVTLGAAGPRGEKGDKGDPGVLGTFDDMAGLPCSFNGRPGRIEFTYFAEGEIRLRCRVIAAEPAKRD